MSRRPLLSLTAGALLTLTACASGTLSADDVATAAENALEKEVGTRPDISCPEELAEEEGATTRCTLAAGDDPVTYGVTVTVTLVDDGTRIGVEVDDEPTN